MSNRTLRTMSPADVTAIIAGGEVVSEARTPESVDLAAKAASVLGYMALQSHVKTENDAHKALVGTAKKKAELVAALSALGALPFIESDVVAYKKKMINPVKTSLAQGWYTFAENTFFDICDGGKISMAFIAVMTFIGAVAGGFMSAASEAHAGPGILGLAAGGAIFAIAVIAAVGITSAVLQVRFGIRVWQDVKISSYEHPIPKDVLALAVALKERAPFVNLKVSALVEKRLEGQLTMPWNDPFLVAEIPGMSEQYHIAVWDELTFEPVRQAR